MRIIHTDEIIKNVKDMCIEANYQLSPDVENRVRRVLMSRKMQPWEKQIL